MSQLDINIDGVVKISRDYYVKSPQALEQLLTRLKEIGYTIDNLREADYRKRDGTSVEVMEKKGYSLWYAHLTDIRYGKCKSCNTYISTSGIQMHGHTCENCGAVTYYDIVDGSTVEFEFVDRSESGMFRPVLCMKALEWDVQRGYLYLYPTPVKCNRWGAVNGEAALQYLAKHSEKWQLLNWRKKKYIRIKYNRGIYIDPSDVISMREVHGHYWNHSIVKIWDGVEYDDMFGRLPIPESFSIYETWHWGKLDASPTLHNKLLSAVGMVSDKGYYYQDGRPAFQRGHWEEIGKFVRHFTTLDADAYDRASRSFRLSGPGGIDDLARFCHNLPQIIHEPNIGNALIAMSKVMNGQRMTPDELVAGIRGSEGENAEFFAEFALGYLRQTEESRRNKGKRK